MHRQVHSHMGTCMHAHVCHRHTCMKKVETHGRRHLMPVSGLDMQAHMYTNTLGHKHTLLNTPTDFAFSCPQGLFSTTKLHGGLGFTMKGLPSMPPGKYWLQSLNSSFLSLATINITTKSNYREEMVYLAFVTWLQVIEGGQGRNSRQELRGTN